MRNVVTTMSCPSGCSLNSLFSDGGTAIIVHGKADDYKTEPSGQFRRRHRLRRDFTVELRWKRQSERSEEPDVPAQFLLRN